MRITFVVPVYNEEPTIASLVKAIRAHCSDYIRQIILVDDGSTDGSSREIMKLGEAFEDVVGVSFAENRGKTAAIAEGFAMAEGEIVFTMDSDLQDDPAEIPRFLLKLEEGYDLVCGWKSVRQDPLGRRFMSRIYNSIVGRIFGIGLHDINCGYKAMRVDVARSLDLKHDYHRLVPVLAAARGFTLGEIEVRHHPRKYGKSRYGFERYWKGLRDVWRVWREIRRAK